jgi:hypothetical protein
MVRTATYYCFLTNGSPDLLKVKLARGFRIEPFGIEEIIDLSLRAEDRSAFNPINRIISNTQYVGVGLDSDGELDTWYAIVREVSSSDVDRVEDRLEKDSWAPLLEQEDELYIQKIILLLNLFRECSVFSSDRFIITNGGFGTIIWHQYTRQPLPIAFDGFFLQDRELENLQSLLDADYPFKEPYIQLAFDNFIESHYIENPKISMLMLMMALEALFSRGNSETSHTIARCCAVLLGDSKEDSREIYDEVKHYYNIRSVLIHGHVSKKAEVSLNDICELRYIVRDSIKRIRTKKLKKDELMRWLDEMGYPG